MKVSGLGWNPKEKIDTIFDSFLKTIKKRKFGGLGLFVYCKDIVDMQEGIIKNGKWVGTSCKSHLILILSNRGELKYCLLNPYL
jgi:signal transduction histidine kinase